MSKSPVQTFKNLLLQAIKHFQLLIKLLEEEKQLLQQPDSTPEALEVLTKRKNELLQLIQQDVDERKHFLEALGYAADMQGIEGFLTSLPENTEKAMRQGWNQLVSLLEAVQEANLFNGRLINRATQHFDLLLNAFKTTQSKVKVYRPTGGSGNLTTPRNLGKA